MHRMIVSIQPLIIERSEPGAQSTLTTEVENFPGFPQGIMGPELMDNMKKQAERFGAIFKRGQATKANLSTRPFKITVDELSEIQTQALIISTGASAMEEANFLTKFASEVRIVHRKNELRASKIMQDRARNNPKIIWSLNYTPMEILGGDKEALKGYLLVVMFRILNIDKL